MPPGSRSDHFDGQRFFNPEAPQAKGLREVIRWKLTSRGKPWPDFCDDVIPTEPPANVAPGELRVTLINHSTVLIQVEECNVLTDPIWSERASPVAWAGPTRHRIPGVVFERLPPIHVVLLSHNHYDHLDLPTVQRLAREHRPQFIVPLGVGALLRSEGIQSTEADWWDRKQAGGLPVTCVPALHFSARGLWDRNRTLWCGYAMETPAGLVYFAGDTGYGKHFREIRDRCGRPRLALLPIGAYKPEWFMSPIHMSPTEAILAHQELAPDLSIGIHFGTFQLADEGEDDAVRDLGKPERFHALRNGEHRTLCR